MSSPDSAKKKENASLGSSLLPGALHERLQFERYSIHHFVRDRIYPMLGSGVRVLDAGSGRIQEQFLREELLETGASLETLDLFPGEGVDFVGDASEMPFEDGQYDLVLCTQVLEHVRAPRKVVGELYRVLKPGGHLAVTAPQSAPLHNLPYHYFHFTKIGFRMMLEEAGFRVLHEEPQGGHFVNLAIQLHYTCKVLREAANSFPKKLILVPAELACRILFGFLFKVLALWLDRVLPFEGNTQGWNFLCVKDAGPRAGEEDQEN